MTPAQQQAIEAMRAAFGHPPQVTYMPVAESFVGSVIYHARVECRPSPTGGLPSIVFTKLDPPAAA